MAALSDPRREAFVQKWHETGNKSEAYRYAYPKSTKWKGETIHKRASELSGDGNVKGRFEELQAASAASHQVTIDSLIAELNENRQVALSSETPQCSAANQATMGKAKLCGLDGQLEQHKPQTISINIVDAAKHSES